MDTKEDIKNETRETFSSGFAVFFAALGSAVGLGNIWKFPYLTGVNGGGAFVATYLICVLLVGIPIMVAEFYLGRKTRKNAVGAFDKLKASPFWKIIGYMGIVSAFLVILFYSSVAGWVYSYVFKAIKGDFLGLSSHGIENASKIAESKYNLLVHGSIEPFIWQLIVMAVVSIILMAGVKKGIERITKTLMPIFFVLIILCDIRALTLPGAKEGLRFLFQVDFTKLNADVILAALGLAFFKLSLGMGTMMTYASYFTEDNNMIATSGKVVLSDTLVSLLAGIAIFPAVFSFGLQPNAGPGLLFMTIPMVFTKVPFGNVLLIMFFILASIAATTALISLVEVPVAFCIEELKMKRTNAVLAVALIVIFIGIFTVHPASLFGDVTIAGKGFFDLFDYISSNITMPLGGLLIAIFVGWLVKKDDFVKQLTNNGTLRSDFANFVYKIIRYITPILVIIIFLNSIGVLSLIFNLFK